MHDQHVHLADQRPDGDPSLPLARFARMPTFPVELYPVDPAATVEAAELLSLSAYDASYLVLARQMRAELVTLDAELAGAAPGLATS